MINKKMNMINIKVMIGMMKDTETVTNIETEMMIDIMKEKMIDTDIMIGIFNFYLL